MQFIDRRKAKEASELQPDTHKLDCSAITAISSAFAGLERMPDNDHQLDEEDENTRLSLGEGVGQLLDFACLSDLQEEPRQE